MDTSELQYIVRWLILSSAILTVVVGCAGDGASYVSHGSAAKVDAARVQHVSSNPILLGAVAQLTNPAQYDASYMKIGYPNGDVPANQGACTDVVIRACRYAGLDLQSAVHKDIVAHPLLYPRTAARVDTNIDHRRVPNLVVYMRRHWKQMSTSLDQKHLKDWQPGDIVMWKIGGRLDHTGVISDRKNAFDLPLVIHNISQTAEEDVLARWPIVGHYRMRAR